MPHKLLEPANDERKRMTSRVESDKPKTYSQPYRSGNDDEEDDDQYEEDSDYDYDVSENDDNDHQTDQTEVEVQETISSSSQEGKNRNGGAKSSGGREVREEDLVTETGRKMRTQVDQTFTLQPCIYLQLLNMCDAVMLTLFVNQS